MEFDKILLVFHHRTCNRYNIFVFFNFVCFLHSLYLLFTLLWLVCALQKMFYWL